MKKSLHLSLLALACSFVCFSFAHAASFDCAKASTFSEKAICKNPVLSQMDDNLGDIYKKTKAKAGDSQEFLTIARGNLALRAQCKDVPCIEKWIQNSIDLYNYLNGLMQEDDLQSYPEEVQQACAEDQAVTVNLMDCIGAKLSFNDKKLKATLAGILDLKITDEQKKQAQEIYDRGIKDMDYFCGIASDVPGSMSGVINYDCQMQWIEKLQALLESRQKVWEDEIEFGSGAEDSPVQDSYGAPAS